MERSIRLAGGLFLAVVAAGCNDGPFGEEGDGGGDPQTVHLGIEPFEVAQGEDHVWCKTMKVPSDVTLDVTSVKITMAPGSHHFILYRSDNDLPDGFGDCTEMDDRLFVTGSQTPVSEWSLPEGLALPLFAGEQLILETHYANASDGPITGEVDVELRLMPHDEVEDYIQTVLIPYTDFEIPPMTTGYVDGMTIPEIGGYNVLSISSHTHKRATLFTIDHLTDAGTERVFTNDDWHAPPTHTFDPPLRTDSDNGWRFECTWTNETDHPIHFGTTTEDEMCIMVMTFFPAYSYSP